MNAREIGEACPTPVADAIHRWYALLGELVEDHDNLETVYDEMADVLDFAPYTGKDA